MGSALGAMRLVAAVKRLTPEAFLLPFDVLLHVLCEQRYPPRSGNLPQSDLRG
jgi:hypothetical protein